MPMTARKRAFLNKIDGTKKRERKEMLFRRVQQPRVEKNAILGLVGTRKSYQDEEKVPRRVD